MLDLCPVGKDRQDILRELGCTELISQYSYLVARVISVDILAHSRFSGAVRQDRFDNVIFPYQDEAGITDFEMKII